MILRASVAAAMPMILVCCGSRTGLFAPGSGVVEEDAALAIQDASTPQEEPEAQAPLAFCSTELGPVDSCDAGVAGGMVQRCSVYEPLCYHDPNGEWYCCSVSPEGLPEVCFPPLAPCE